ncbi:MAG: hypothetical protein ACF8PN_16445 [Phycisphaerales bacterium]
MIRRSVSARRGSAYVLVLMISMLVVVTGLGGLLTNRVRRQAQSTVRDMETARRLAISAIDLALLEVATTNWRSTRLNDTWTTPQPLGAGDISYKFVDEIDGILADDATEPVKLIGRGVIGSTIQMSSVRLDDGKGVFSSTPLNGSWRREVNP